MKLTIKKSPEIILIFGVLFYWIESSIIFNPIAIILLLFLGLTLLTKSKIIKALTSIIFSLLSIFMLLAVLSEYREFETGNMDGIQLLVVGLSIFVTTLGLSIIIGIKNVLNVEVDEN